MPSEVDSQFGIEQTEGHVPHEQGVCDLRRQAETPLFANPPFVACAKSQAGSAASANSRKALPIQPQPLRSEAIAG